MAVFKPGVGATFAGAVTITSGGLIVSSGVAGFAAGQYTDRGTTSAVVTATPTTIASPTINGLYDVTARIAGSTTACYMRASRTNGVISSLNANNVGNISLAVSGGTAIQVTQTTGSNADVLWAYSVVATQ